jgi:hypothetical protein
VIGGFELDQARAGVPDVEHDVDDDNREDGEAANVEPTPVLATRPRVYIAAKQFLKCRPGGTPRAAADRRFRCNLTSSAISIRFSLNRNAAPEKPG